MSNRYAEAARQKYFLHDDKVQILEEIDTSVDGGAWVSALIWVSDEEVDPDPGPTYNVWIAEQTALHPTVGPGGYFVDRWHWPWIHDQTFTCDDDPDGKGARAFAHKYARYLRSTYPCAYVAVLPASKMPKPIHIP